MRRWPSNWAVTTLDIPANCASGTAADCRLPDGWEPFAAPGFSTVFVRRCAR